MYLWLEEMGLINEPKRDRNEQLKDFAENMRIVSRKNKAKRKRNNLILRGRAV